MNMPLILVLAMLVLAVAAMVPLFVLVERRNKRLAAEYADDPDIEIRSNKWSDMTIHARPPRPTAHIVRAGGGKNAPPLWNIYVEVPQLGARTMLSLSKEGLSGALREKLGVKDLHIGDAQFDKEFTIRGSNSEAIVALLLKPEVQDAVYAFFEECRIQYLELGSASQLVCVASRGDGEIPAGKALLLRTISFAAVLEAHASDLP